MDLKLQNKLAHVTGSIRSAVGQSSNNRRSKFSTCKIESGKTGELALHAIDAAKVLNVFRIAQRTSILARF